MLTLNHLFSHFQNRKHRSSSVRLTRSANGYDRGIINYAVRLRIDPQQLERCSSTTEHQRRTFQCQLRRNDVDFDDNTVGLKHELRFSAASMGDELPGTLPQAGHKPKTIL